MPTESTSAPAAPLLDAQLCFALHDAARAIVGCYRPLLDAAGITYTQYLVLLVLWEHGTRSVRDLGKALHLDSGTLSPLLKRMEASGLIERRRGTDDERQVHVDLTADGLALRERAVEIPNKLHAATGIDAETLELLARACKAILEEAER